MKLQTLKPRLATIANPIRMGDSWRADKQSSSARGYGSKWQRARERFLRDHPVCAYCEKAGRTTAATVVDHIVPHCGDQSLFWSESNWQPLCKPCHDVTKAREEGRGGAKV